MGREPDLVSRNSVHGPQHLVTLTKGFYIGKFETTQAQWTAVMETKPWEDRLQENCPNCPVTYVSWADANTFLEQLTAVSDGTAIYRLPAEAEWEYVVRAGTNTAWPFGDDSSKLADYAWHRGNTCGISNEECFIRAVGLKLPNPWGTYDMHGNVWEWVEDWWVRIYTTEQQIDPVNETDRIEEPMIRGGGIGNPGLVTRSGYRTAIGSGAQLPDIGFRIVGTTTAHTQAPPTSWGGLKQQHSVPTFE